MSRLTSRDTVTLLRAIENLNSDLDPRSLPRRAISTLDSLVENNLSNFDFFSPQGRYALTAWTNREDLVESPHLESFKRFIHQNPAIPLAFADSNGNPFKVTDGVTQAEFQRTELYNEYFRKIGIDHQMGLAMPVASDLTVCCAVGREKKDFTERDRVMMKLAAPHLLSALKNALAYGRVTTALQTLGSGVVAFASSGRIEFASKFAQTLLEKYFHDDGRESDELPATIAGWIKQSSTAGSPEITLPPRPLRVETRAGVLTVRLMQNSLTRERTILLEEKAVASPRAVIGGVTLTRRETEILFWIVSGKTNAVIASLCGISLRTVHKHVEHLYQKLGVETRTAAMLLAIDTF